MSQDFSKSSDQGERVHAAWVHDHPFFGGPDGDYYSKSGVDQAALARYLRYFDTLMVIGRVSKEQSLIGKSRINSPRIAFNLLLPNYRRLLFHRGIVRKDLRNAIEQTDCCIILLPSQLGVLAAMECRNLAKPYVIQVIGCAWDALWNHGSILAKCAAPLAYLQTRNTVRRAPYVTYITETFLQRRYPTKGISGNGIPNVVLGDSGPHVLETRRQHIRDLPKRHAQRLGLIGSLNVNYKGQDTAIKALGTLIHKYPNMELRLLGPGDSARWIRLAEKYGVRDQVIFEGTLPAGEQVMAWIDELDVYIQPSRAEGHGRSIVEAMSRGCPTFGSNIGGICDSLGDGSRFPPKDYRKLARLIDRALSEEHFALSCAEENFAVSEHFSVGAIGRKRDKFFNVFLDHNDFPPLAHMS